MSLENLDVRDVFFDKVYQQCKNDPNLIIISADMDAFSLRKIARDFPNQYLNVGVSEQNMINVAAGMALFGKRVLCYSIASFATLRCFEQIKVNLCSLNLPVTIVGAGAGFSFGYDGPTHHGHQDLSAMRLLPEMTIIELSSNDVVEAAARYACVHNGPCYIRLDKGAAGDWSHVKSDFKNGFRILRPLRQTNIVTNGYMTKTVLQVADKLAMLGYEVGVVDLFIVKPTPKKLYDDIIERSLHIISVEESCKTGGLGSILSELIAQNETDTKLTVIGVPDKQFVEYGERSWFHKKYSIDHDSLVKRINDLMVLSAN